MINIIFRSTDFGNIDECINKTITSTIIAPEDDILGFDGLEDVQQYQIYKTILYRFLDIVQTKTDDLIVNNPNENEGNEDKREFVAKFNDNKFGGIVGTVRKTLVFEKKDLLQDSTSLDKVYICVTLQLKSRFDSENKSFFLFTMLQQFLDIKLSNNEIPEDDDSIFEFLFILLFKTKFERSYLKGFYRTYHTFTRNDEYFKGSLNIYAHIKNNMGLNNGKIAYSFREKTIDNYLNHLILEAFNCLKKNHPNQVLGIFESNHSFNMIFDNLKYSIGYPKYDIRTIIAKNINPISHPYYVEYEELRNICIRILRYESINFFDGQNDDDVQGILFYVPRLWEIYIENNIKEYAASLNFSAQNLDKVFCYKKNDNTFDKGKLEIIPDFVFKDENNKAYMILDAKFKPEWGEQIAKENAISNLRGDYDKCIRDMNAFNVHATGTVFPSKELNFETDIEKYIEHGISKYNLIDRFYTFPVFIPSNESKDLETWQKEMSESNKRTVVKITEVSEKEKIYCREVNDLLVTKRR